MSDPIDRVALDRAALDQLNEMTGGDPEFLVELIDTFLGDGPTLVAAMRAAATSRDAVALQRAAHTLKSNCRTFGATTLGELCQEIEKRAAGGRFGEEAALIGRVQAEYPAVVTALDAIRREAR